jgi:hypothetical protein
VPSDPLFLRLPASEFTGKKARLTDGIVRQEIAPADAKPGDIVVAHSKGIFGALIRLGTRSRWNHAAVVVEAGADPLVVQAEARGVSSARLSTVAPGGYTAILRCPAGVDRYDVVGFATAAEGTAYGFFTILSITRTILTPGFIHLNFRRGGTYICSALCSFALLAGGWLHPWTDYYQVSPAELASALVA